MNVRQRYFVVTSAVYIILGGAILARSIVAHVVPVAILGLVFMALGAVRLRDYFSGGRSTR